MSLETELDRLAARCEGSVSIDLNQHKASLRTVVEEIDWLTQDDPSEKLAPDDVLIQMIRLDKMVAILFEFTNIGPGGVFTVFHYDPLGAVLAAHEVLDEERKKAR